MAVGIPGRTVADLNANHGPLKELAAMPSEHEIYRALMDWRERHVDAFRLDLSAELAKEFADGLPATTDELLFRTAMVVNNVSTSYVFRALSHYLEQVLGDGEPSSRR